MGDGTKERKGGEVMQVDPCVNMTSGVVGKHDEKDVGNVVDMGINRDEVIGNTNDEVGKCGGMVDHNADTNKEGVGTHAPKIINVITPNVPLF